MACLVLIMGKVQMRAGREWRGRDGVTATVARRGVMRDEAKSQIQVPEIDPE